jgi:hypothetical protein
MKKTTGRSLYVLLFLALFFNGFTTVTAWAQADPTKVLVGAWEGWVEGIPQPQERWLVISSVKPKEGGGWIADGRYGYTAEKGARHQIEVSTQGGDTILEFSSADKNPVRLKLVGDNKLEGTANFVTSGRTTNRSVKFEKKPIKSESK